MNEISMKMVVSRSKEPKTIFFGEASYPLHSNYTNTYNYKNLLDSIKAWNKFSSIQEECVDKMLELFTIINEQGTIKQIDECNSIVINNLSKVQDTKDIRSHLRLMKGTEAIQQSLDVTDQINNIIQTHSDICTRFNIDRVVNNTADVKDCIYEVCSLIDTYNIGLNSKYKICLNENQFALRKNGIECDDSVIVEAVTDYFLCNHMDPKDEQREILYIMEDVIEHNIFIQDKSYIDDLIRVSVGEETEESEYIIERLNALSEANDIKKIKDEALKKFKAMPNKTVGAFKNLLQVFLNTNREEDLIDDTPNILAICFYFFITVGALSINLWLGCVVGIAAIFCRTFTTRKSTEKALKKWHKARASAQAKYEQEKDPEKKEKMKIYIKGLDSAIEKIENHYNALKDEEEKEAIDRRPENYNGKSSDDDFTTNFNFDSYGEDVKYLNAIANIMESIEWSPELVNMSLILKDRLKGMKPHEFEYLTKFAKANPEFIDNQHLSSVFAECVSDLRSSEKPDYVAIAKLNECRCILDEESDIIEQPKSLKTIAEDMLALYNDTKNINSYIHEMSISNIVQIAVDKVKNGLGSLDAAQTTVSNQIDAFARQTERGMTKAVNYGNREAVVKGDILPPLSKCLKLVLAAGGLYFINPYLALLACISAGFVRSKALKKEKQLFMDELDVELTMIEKYIKKAEEENNLKRVKQLLLIKKKLQTHYAKMRWYVKSQYTDDDIEAARGAMKHGEED